MLGFELRPIVDVDNGLILNMNQHFRLAIYDLELAGHGNQVGIVGEERWPLIYPSVCRIAVRQFDNFNGITPPYDVLLRGSQEMPIGLYHLYMAKAEQLCRLHYSAGSF